MKIVSFIEGPPVIEKILRHCNFWRNATARPPPNKNNAATVTETEPLYDYSFVEPA